jgi:hypothetical protein
MGKSKIEYRGTPTSACPYLLETTPETHYVSAVHKIIEVILIERFGKKNIPSGNFWRLADTSTQVYGAQKYLWPILKRLCKTYDGRTVLSMVQRRRIKYLTAKMIPRYLYWCKEEKDLELRAEQAKSRYIPSMEKPEHFDWTCPNCGSVHNQDVKHCPCRFETGDDNLLDWLDS